VNGQAVARYKSGELRYFCQVRFLWRLVRSFFRRLCLLIFAFRRFFNEPIIFSLFLACRACPALCLGLPHGNDNLC
jgi:hypothetical protein